MLEFLMMGRRVVALPGGGGEAGFALFAGGASSAATNKYDFNTAAVASGSNLGLGRMQLTGVSNYVKAIYGGGGWSDPTTARTDLYTFTTDAVIQGSNLGVARYGTGAVGNVEMAIFAGGRVASGTYQTYIDKYTYATDARVASGNLSVALSQSSGIGNAQFGLIGGGENDVAPYNLAYVTKYTYASGLKSVANGLASSKNGAATLGDTQFGMWAGGSGGVRITDKHKYADDTRLAGTMLILGRTRPVGASNAVIGVVGAGTQSTGRRTTETYAFASNVVAASSSLAVDFYDAACASSSPGGF